jgi:hypothetical protein
MRGPQFSSAADSSLGNHEGRPKLQIFPSRRWGAVRASVPGVAGATRKRRKPFKVPLQQHGLNKKPTLPQRQVTQSQAASGLQEVVIVKLNLSDKSGECD